MVFIDPGDELEVWKTISGDEYLLLSVASPIIVFPFHIVSGTTIKTLLFSSQHTGSQNLFLCGDRVCWLEIKCVFMRWCGERKGNPTVIIESLFGINYGLVPFLP